MIVPQEPYKPESKKAKIAYSVITVTVLSLILIVVGTAVINAVISVNDFWAPGSGTEVSGAPDGTYLQKDWGSFDNKTRMWDFAICDHDYLGPLHGSWKVAEGVSVPMLGVQGVYPIDARLYITIQNNIIVYASVHSQMEYGN